MTLPNNNTPIVNRPHLDKLMAALSNPKCSNDIETINQCITTYNEWIKKLNSLSSKGREKVGQMVDLLNWYKDRVEVDLIMTKGSEFLKRQKGQLKIDNTILEEFLKFLIHPDVLEGIENIDKLALGPHNAFMSLAFFPTSLKDLLKKPNVILKTKDQDFIIGAKIFYKFATDSQFTSDVTSTGTTFLSILSAECKVNLDKTMFQEASGTAARLKQGCPVAKYFVLVEYLDMEPEDSRLTSIDNVYLLRHARRLPFDKRNSLQWVTKQRKEFPIDSEIVWRFVQELQTFVDSTLYDPNHALDRGSFV